MLEISQAGQVFQPLYQTIFLMARQSQDSKVATGIVQRSFASANAGGWWAGLADRGRSCHGEIFG